MSIRKQPPNPESMSPWTFLPEAQVLGPCGLPASLGHQLVTPLAPLQVIHSVTLHWAPALYQQHLCPEYLKGVLYQELEN